MSQNSAHTALVAAILAACGSRPDCRLWGNATGFARGLTHDGVIKFGLKGSADIIGIGLRINPLFRFARAAFHHGNNCFFSDNTFEHELNGIRGTPGIPVGRPPHVPAWLAIEVKTGRAVQSKHQIAFQKMIEKFGGHYLVARDVESVVTWLDGLLLTQS